MQFMSRGYCSVFFITFRNSLAKMQDSITEAKKKKILKKNKMLITAQECHNQNANDLRKSTNNVSIASFIFSKKNSVYIYSYNLNTFEVPNGFCMILDVHV